MTFAKRLSKAVEVYDVEKELSLVAFKLHYRMPHLPQRSRLFNSKRRIFLKTLKKPAND